MGTAEEQFERLYMEALDIGNMLKITFGREYAEQYSYFLGQFAILTRELISAQLEGNTEAAAQRAEDIFRNVDERAAY